MWSQGSQLSSFLKRIKRKRKRKAFVPSFIPLNEENVYFATVVMVHFNTRFGSQRRQKKKKEARIRFFSLFFYLFIYLFFVCMSSYLIPKDLPPPSYESLYQSIPSCSIHSENQSFIKRFFRKHGPFLQKLTAAIFVAATVSTTVMLLLWQLQNLTTTPPPENDDPWFDPSYQEY